MKKSLPSRKQFEQNAPMHFREKIIPWEQLSDWLAVFRATTKNPIVTKGGFDRLRLGQVIYLENAVNHEERRALEWLKQSPNPDPPVRA